MKFDHACWQIERISYIYIQVRATDSTKKMQQNSLKKQQQQQQQQHVNPIRGSGI